jgi:VWFA-related protein
VLRVGLSLVLVALATTVLPGQQTTPPRQSQPPVFRTEIEAVQMNVFVTDADGKPVSGLTQDDFEVFENDKPQAITTFAAISTPPERHAPPPLDAEPDVQTNERGYRHVYLILLGNMGALGADLPEEAALKTRFRVREFLTEHFGDNDLAAIFALSASSTQDGQDFTGSRRLLLEAIDKFNGQAVIMKIGEDFWQHMELLSRIPAQRKSVILFGSARSAGVGDIFDIIDYRGGVQSLGTEFAHAAVATASRANIPIYLINPMGEVAIDPDSRTLARLTGGFAHVSGNDFKTTFERLTNETSTYYMLGFNSSLVRKQGRHIELEARVKRPGLTVRSRSGYVEQLEYIRANMPPEPKRTPVEEALANPLATTGVTMRVTAAPFRQSDRMSTVALAVQVDPETLRFTERNGRYLATFEVRHLVTDARAKIYPEYRHRGSLDLDARSYQRVSQTGIRVVSQFDLPEGRYQVRVASARGARNGSVVYDLVVPDFGDDPFTMSGVALTTTAGAGALTFRPDRNQREKQTATGCRERVCESGVAFSSLLVPYATPAAASERPLLSEVLPAAPATTRDFAPSETLSLFTEVYDNEKPGRKDPPYAITLTATLHSADSVAVGQASEKRDSAAARRKSGGHGFTLKLPLEGVAPGSYVLRVEASSSRNEKHRVSRSIPIRVR